jgi:hypothetical protein
MVLGLPGKVGFDLIHLGITHGEGAIPRLSCETAPIRIRLVDPLGGIRLDPA